jgi:hypothetical protein
LTAQEPVGLAKKITCLADDLIAMDMFCLDRLLEQRSALRKRGIPLDFPPQRGGLRSLSVGAVCLAAEITSSFRAFIQSPTNS